MQMPLTLFSYLTASIYVTRDKTYFDMLKIGYFLLNLTFTYNKVIVCRLLQRFELVQRCEDFFYEWGEP